MKIVFDLEKFKEFLEDLEDIEYDSGCRAVYETHKYVYELTNKNDVEFKHYGSKCHGDKWKLLDSEVCLKGEIIDG